MPKSLETLVVFNGYARNAAPSINSIPKLEVEIFIGEKYNRVVFSPVVFQGNQNHNNIGAGISSSNSSFDTGFKHKMNSIEFQGNRPKSESTLLFVDDLEVSIPDSQDYVVVKEVVQANLPFWS